MPFRLIPTSVADVVLPPVERLRPQAERTGLGITIDLPPDLPPVLADEERIQQVVTNLVHNAIKFTPSGGEVTIKATASGDEVVVSVRDTIRAYLLSHHYRTPWEYDEAELKEAATRVERYAAASHADAITGGGPLDGMLYLNASSPP